MKTISSLVIGLFFLIAVIALYFLPYIVARNRKHKNAEAIGMLNFLLGWTAIGWIVAIIWACTANTKEA